MRGKLDSLIPLAHQMKTRVYVVYILIISYISVKKKTPPEDKFSPGSYADEEWQNSSPGIALVGDSFRL